MSDRPRHLVVMGVSGCGKSTVGRALAARLGGAVGEGAEFHPAANIAKMSAGIPLTDEDRAPWLAALHEWLAGRERAGAATVLACSSLKRSYRDVLRGTLPGVVFVYLAVSEDELRRRIASRRDHFMSTKLLQSQVATLEPPSGDEVAITVTAAEPESATSVVERIETQLSSVE